MVLLLPSDSSHWGAFGLTPPALIGRRRKKATGAEPAQASATTVSRGTTPAGSATTNNDVALRGGAVGGS